MVMVMVKHSLFLMQKQTPRDARNKQRTEMAMDRDALHQHYHHCRPRRLRHNYHAIITMIKCVVLSSKNKQKVHWLEGY